MTASSALIKNAVVEYQTTFGERPRFVVAAPGRVNVIGEHIDYNDGFVLPAAIDRYVVVAGSPAIANTGSGTDCYEIRSTQFGETVSVYGSEELQPGRTGWEKYPVGVIAGFQRRSVAVPSLKAIVTSDVPVGSGLSSSAAIEVAFAMFLQTLCGIEIPSKEIALLCQTAEHEFAGVPCGIMDQYASVFARPDSLILLDCRSNTHRRVPFDSTEVSLLVINSGANHELASSEYSIRRDQCDQAKEKLNLTSFRDAEVIRLPEYENDLTQLEFKRVRHVVTETERTIKAAQMIEAKDWTSVGKLMYASHESLRSDYDVSCDELDMLVEIAGTMNVEDGIYGSRMTGGGFGGSTISLVRSEESARVSTRICHEYEKQTGIIATPVFIKPALGAHVVDC